MTPTERTFDRSAALEIFPGARRVSRRALLALWEADHTGYLHVPAGWPIRQRRRIFDLWTNHISIQRPHCPMVAALTSGLLADVYARPSRIMWELPPPLLAAVHALGRAVSCWKRSGVWYSSISIRVQVRAPDAAPFAAALLDLILEHQ